MTRVLVVDDDQKIAALVQDTLQDEGYMVECARDAAAALTHIAQRWPDVMLLDLRMPVMDGWSLLAACRLDPRGADLPVVVMSAALEERRAEDLGVAFLAKPFDLDNLLLLVQHALPGQPQSRRQCAPAELPLNSRTLRNRAPQPSIVA
jgi:CheY-like chemotaxis protein